MKEVTKKNEQEEKSKKALVCPYCQRITSKTHTPDDTYVCDECGSEWDAETY